MSRTSTVGWTFLTNHTHVLVSIHRNPTITMHDIAAQVGITERAVQRIIADLIDANVIHRSRVGRNNHYTIQPHHPLRHPLEHTTTIHDLLDLIDPDPADPDRHAHPLP